MACVTELLCNSANPFANLSLSLIRSLLSLQYCMDIKVKGQPWVGNEYKTNGQKKTFDIAITMQKIGYAYMAWCPFGAYQAVTDHVEVAPSSSPMQMKLHIGDTF